MKKLSDEQINYLLKEAEKATEESRSLTSVFADFAKKTGRAKGGIRNFYYAMLKENGINGNLSNTYPSLKKLRAERNCAFTKSEEEELFAKVTQGVRSGKSVRRTISEMAHGDEKIALRYQNKYRNLLRKNGASPRYEFYKDDAEYKTLKKAVDDLFERILRQKTAKEADLKRENEFLKEQLRSLKGEKEKSKAEKFFLSRGVSRNKAKKVPE